MKYVVAILLASSLPSLAAGREAGSYAERTFAIVGVAIIFPERDASAAVSKDMTIVVRGSRIERVGPAATTTVPKGVPTMQGAGRWIIPGLIDSHVHFFQSGNLYTRPDGVDFGETVPYAEEDSRNRARLSATLKVWLASGVTSVIDVGGPTWTFRVRDQASSTDAAPRVQLAGTVMSMFDYPKLDLGDPPIVKINSPESARNMVASVAAHHPNYIKFISEPGDDLAATAAIVGAAAEASHAAGIPLAVHATDLALAKTVLRAGADYLVHSVDNEPVDEEFIALMRARRAIYCPTLFVPIGIGSALSNTWRPTEAEMRLADPDVLRAMGDLDRMPRTSIPAKVIARIDAHKRPALSPVEADNLRRLWNAGITVVLGTDAGNPGVLHGPSVFREMELMHEAGLSTLEVLRSATSNGAKALRMDGDVGRIAPGMLADLVVLDADPLADIANASRAYRVIRDGVIFNPVVLMRSIH